MQQLLTGRVRLPGFSGQWQEVKLGDLGESFNGLTGKSKDDFGEGSSFISYLNVFNNSKIDIHQFDSVKIEADENQNEVKYGDLFFTVSSETPEEVGMCSVLLDHVEGVYLNSFCFGFRLHSFDILSPEFARYFFRAYSIRKKITSLAQGSTRFNLSKNQMKKMQFSLPPTEEQTAIARILTTADAELALLERRLAALQAQKRGLMQVLLTGKIRVKV